MMVMRTPIGGSQKVGMRKFECFDCQHKWEEPYGTGRPAACPSCGSRNLHRSAEDKGRRGTGQGRGGCGSPPV